VAILGIIAALCSYLRYYDDMSIDYRIASTKDAYDALEWANYKAFMAILPSLVLTFLQVATLAAISVAISTRYGLAANVTVVVIIYVAANLARYVQSTTDLPAPFAAIATVLAYLLPGLSLMDLNQRLVFGDYILSKKEWDLAGGSLPTYGQMWQYVGIACVYAVFYIGASLSFGMALFRSRELT
jgi:hypothetical protein